MSGGSGTGRRATGIAADVGALVVNTITTAANASGITSVKEHSETMSDRLEEDVLPWLRYSILEDHIDEVHAGLAFASRTADKELRKRRKYRWTLSLRCLLAAETESAAERYLKAFLKNLPKNVSDEDGMDVKITPRRAERRGFARTLVEVFPKREIAVFITFAGGIYTGEEVGLIKEVTITPEV